MLSKRTSWQDKHGVVAYTSPEMGITIKKTGVKITVIFDMWGQRCKTEFDEDSELSFDRWILTVCEKGWMLPVEVIREDGLVLFNEKELEKLIAKL